jgi:hypothetical protein
MGSRAWTISVALVNGIGKGANPRSLETDETDTAESSPANYGGKTAGSCRLSNVGSAPSKSAGSPGLWSATFAWVGRNRRFSKDYAYRVHTSETLLDVAATRLMLNRLTLA